MVLCGVDPERRASKELEKKISLWMKEYNKAIKILLLGVLFVVLCCVALGAVDGVLFGCFVLCGEVVVVLVESE